MNTVQLNQSYKNINEAILRNDSATVQNNVQQIINHATPNQIQQILNYHMGDGTTLVGLANGNQANAEQRLLNANQIMQSLGALQQAAQPNQLEGWQNPPPHPASTR